MPLTADELAVAARTAADAGAAAVHIHPRDDSGAETLADRAVSAVVAAIRARCPDLPVGVSTGAWIEPSLSARLAAIRSWTVRPDFASVNVHESGAAEVALALAELGVGVEAGVWWPAAVPDYLGWPVPCLRILVECMDSAAAAALENASAVLAALADAPRVDRPPVLLHGAGSASWPVLREALRLGLDTRIGLEDTLLLPDGSLAPGNAALVAAAVALSHGG